MSNETHKASERQLRYINSLRKKLGMQDTEIPEDITSTRASRLISELIAMTKPHNQFDRPVKTRREAPKPDQGRLNLAMSEVFRLWQQRGEPIGEDQKSEFIRQVRETYNLFGDVQRAALEG